MKGYIFNIQSMSDVITNSSSELFTYMGDENSKADPEVLKQLISFLDAEVPNWKDEYFEPQFIKDIDKDLLHIFIFHAMCLTCEEAQEQYYYNKKHGRSQYMHVTKEMWDRNDCWVKARLKAWLNMEPEEAFLNWDIFNPFTESPNIEPGDSEDWEDEWDRVYADYWDRAMLKYSSKFYEEVRKQYGGAIVMISRYDNPNMEGQLKIEQFATKVLNTQVRKDSTPVAFRNPKMHRSKIG